LSNTSFMHREASVRPSRYVTLAVLGALTLATLVAFSGVLTSDFIDQDDQEGVVRNPYIRQGL